MSAPHSATEGAVFDHDHYLDQHVPLALRTWGPERAEIDKGVDGSYVVLVHGAWHDARCREGVRAELHEQGI